MVHLDEKTFLFFLSFFITEIELFICLSEPVSRVRDEKFSSLSLDSSCSLAYLDNLIKFEHARWEISANQKKKDHGQRIRIAKSLNEWKKEGQDIEVPGDRNTYIECSR